MEIAVPWVQVFVLGVARVAAFIVQAPILGSSAVDPPQSSPRSAADHVAGRRPRATKDDPLIR